MKNKRVNLIIPHAPCKRGDMGMDVFNLQVCLDHILKYRGKNSLIGNEQGHFGPLTEKAVRDFQESHGLYINGQFTPLTRLRIKEVLHGNHN